MKKLLLCIAISTALTSFSLVGCNKNSNKNHLLENYSIHHDDEFGGAYIDISIDSFNKLGFTFGDSVDLSFTTGNKKVEFNDIGYYSGYYVPAGQELLVGYKGYDYIKYCINYGEDIYAENNFDENTKVTIKLNKAGRYLDVEETLSITYSDDRNDAFYQSDEQFANFREVTAGKLKPGTLYRGASPVDNTRKRAGIVDNILKKNNIKFDIDLSDKEENISKDSKYVVNDYFKGLMDDNKAIFLGMAAAYKADDFSRKMKVLFESMIDNDGPYYIHCLEGKDRTGYVCMVLEALCGATYNELVDDYFVTYKNYYGIEKDTEKYNTIKAIHIDEMIRYVFGFEKGLLLAGAAYHTSANQYLLNIGLTQEQIDTLQIKLSK